MDNSNITISVSEDAARAFEACAEERRKTIELLLGMRLEELVRPSKVSLLQLMDEVGQEARKRGLTPEVLESILSEPSDG